MSNVAPFPTSPPKMQSSSPEAAKLLEAIWALVPLLPVEDQQRLADDIVRAVRPIPAFRSGDALGAIVRFLPRRQNWTAAEIREEIAAAGVKATSREVFNAIGYLVRRGHVKRLGNGQYLVGGGGIQTSDDLGGAPARYED